MNWHREDMAKAMRRLFIADPDSVLDMAELGPMEEPFCAVCASLVDIANDRMPGWRAALYILEYHDEPTYLHGEPRDYENDDPWSIGLTQVLTYQRCLHVYQAANDVLDQVQEEIIHAVTDGLAGRACGADDNGPGQDDGGHGQHHHTHGVNQGNLST